MGVAVRRYIDILIIIVLLHPTSESDQRLKDYEIPYSRKIWRELYSAIWPPTAEIKY